jgi:hypothetical protein
METAENTEKSSSFGRKRILYNVFQFCKEEEKQRGLIIPLEEQSEWQLKQLAKVNGD